MQTNEREEVNLFFTGNSNAVKITDRVRMCQFVLSGVSKQPLKFDRYYVKLRFFLSVFEINQPHRNKGRFFLMKAAHHDSFFFFAFCCFFFVPLKIDSMPSNTNDAGTSFVLNESKSSFISTEIIRDQIKINFAHLHSNLW